MSFQIIDPRRFRFFVIATIPGPTTMILFENGMEKHTPFITISMNAVGCVRIDYTTVMECTIMGNGFVIELVRTSSSMVAECSLDGFLLFCELIALNHDMAQAGMDLEEFAFDFDHDEFGDGDSIIDVFGGSEKCASCFGRSCELCGLRH